MYCYHVFVSSDNCPIEQQDFNKLLEKIRRILPDFVQIDGLSNVGRSIVVSFVGNYDDYCCFVDCLNSINRCLQISGYKLDWDQILNYNQQAKIDRIREENRQRDLTQQRFARMLVERQVGMFPSEIIAACEGD